MPGLPLSRRLATAARWPLGITLTSWRYMWRTTPFHRGERDGSPSEDSPPPLPDGADLDEVQGAEQGYGPLFHRRYRAFVRDPELPARELMSRLQGDPDEASPREFATFIKVQIGRASCRERGEIRG